MGAWSNIVKITITRSKQYVADRQIALGINVPADVEVEIDPATLTTEARRLLIESYGIYPTLLRGIQYGSDFVISSYSCYGRQLFLSDCEPAEVSAHLASTLIVGAYAEIGKMREQARLVSEAEQASVLAARAERLAQQIGVAAQFLADPDARYTRRSRGSNVLSVSWINVLGVNFHYGDPDHAAVVTEALRREQANLDARTQAMRDWAEAHGTDRLHLMLELNTGDWENVAQGEFFDAHAPEGYMAGSIGENERRKPSLLELQELAKLSDLAKQSEGILSSPKLYWVVKQAEYSPEPGEDIPERRYALAEIKIHAPNGASMYYSRELG